MARGVDLTDRPTFALGGANVRPAIRAVESQGEVHQLEARVMQVLVSLARADGGVVSRDALLADCWQGRIVSDDAINRCVGVLRRLGRITEAFTITTVYGVGYRLEASSASALGGFKPIVSVHAFDNLSGDPRDTYLARGLAEEIGATLSRFRSILVTTDLDARPAEAPSGGSSTGGQPRYALRGSVRKDRDRVRIVARLVDAKDGLEVWIRRFDDATSDLFKLQDSVACAVAGVVAPAVLQAEVSKAVRRPARNPTGYDLYLRALSVPIVTTPAALQESLSLLERSIALDPTFAPALSRAALGYRNRYLSGWSDDPARDLRRAIELAHGSLEMSVDDADVIASAASVLGRLGGDTSCALGLLDRALELNPESAWVWFVSGRLRVAIGDTERGAEQIETSLQIQSASLLRPSQLLNLGLAYVVRHRFAEARALLLESHQLRASSWQTLCVLAACHGHLGEADAAREAMTKAIALNPALDVASFARQTLFDVAQRGVLLAGLSGCR